MSLVAQPQNHGRTASDEESSSSGTSVDVGHEMQKRSELVAVHRSAPPSPEGSGDDAPMNMNGGSVSATAGSSKSKAKKRREARRKKRSDYLRVDLQGVWAVVSQRTTVLVSLLLLQSLSQFILEMYEGLISSHVIIPLFLTMLVGAGGNAGNQATVRAITGLVAGEFKPRQFLLVLRKEAVCGLASAIIIAVIGFCRVYFLYGTDNLFWSTMAITTSLFSIVISSIIIGCSLPFFLGFIGFDREHAAPIIQVMMDIIGVFITCSICTVMIPKSEHRSTAHGTNAPGGATASPAPGAGAAHGYRGWLL